MRILQINAWDDPSVSGADRAMDRLNYGLRAHGIDSRILCGEKRTDADIVSEFPPVSGMTAHLQTFLVKATRKLGLNFAGALRPFKINRMEEYKRADVLHFHDIHQENFNYLALPRLTRSKPAVFTFHDMWAITGHGIYSYDCERWKTGCGNCPYPNAWPAVERDSTRLEWHLKNWTFKRADFTIVAPSRWMARIVRQSMLSDFDVRRIPHGIDTATYRPLDRRACRADLGIPPGKKVLMYAARRTGFHRKGADLFEKAVDHLPPAQKKETALLVVGNRSEEVAASLDMPAFPLGLIESEREMARAYTASDLFIFPTRAENVGLVALESLACGTPVVSFDVGGVSDAVRPGVTGYLAEPEDAEDLARGIVTLLEDEALRGRMREQCRSIAENEYPIELHVKRHVRLYEELLQKDSAAKDSAAEAPSVRSRAA